MAIASEPKGVRTAVPEVCQQDEQEARDPALGTGLHFARECPVAERQ